MIKSIQLAIIATLMLFVGCKTSNTVGGNDFSTKNFNLKIATTGCNGTCPVYTLNINEQGEVIYKGEAHTELVGTYTNKVDDQQIQAILSLLESYGYWNWEKVYDKPDLMDIPSCTLSVNSRKQAKQVTKRAGGPTNFYELIDKIHEIILANSYQPIE